MSGRLKPYFYFVLCMGAIPDSSQQKAEPVQVIGDGKHIRQDFTLGAENEAIMFILWDINANKKIVIVIFHKIMTFFLKYVNGFELHL